MSSDLALNNQSCNYMFTLIMLMFVGGIFVFHHKLFNMNVLGEMYQLLKRLIISLIEYLERINTPKKEECRPTYMVIQKSTIQMEFYDKNQQKVTENFGANLLLKL